MKPLIILIDDVRHPEWLRPLRGNREHYEFVVARTSAEGIALLIASEGREVAEVWLDYDLGLIDEAGRPQPPSETVPDGMRKDTMEPVMGYLAERAFDEKPYPASRFIVHSSNPSGAQGLLQTLTRWSYPATRVAASEWFSRPE